MGIPVLILGESGSGKSASLRERGCIRNFRCLRFRLRYISGERSPRHT